MLGEAGIGAQTLLAVDGKVPDSLPVRLVDGRVAALEVYELAQLELPGVEKLQFVHHSPAEVEILYQSPDDLDAALEAAFRRLLAQKSATIETVRVRRVERILNDLTTYKLRSVIAPGEPMITPSLLAEADNRVAIPAPARPVGPPPPSRATCPLPSGRCSASRRSAIPGTRRRSTETAGSPTVSSTNSPPKLPANCSAATSTRGDRWPCCPVTRRTCCR